MLWILFYLLKNSSTHEILIKSQVISHQHKQSPAADLYKNVCWLQLHWIKEYNAQRYAFLKASNSKWQS